MNRKILAMAVNLLVKTRLQYQFSLRTTLEKFYKLSNIPDPNMKPFSAVEVGDLSFRSAGAN